MKFNLIIFFFFFISCSQNHSRSIPKTLYSSKGFAYIFNEQDFNDKIINQKLDNNLFQIAHNKLKPGKLIKLINPKTNDSIILINSKKFEFPEFYKIMITQPVANILNLEPNLPLIEVIEIKKNKSFIASKTKIFNEEKKIHSNAPVENVKIDNISKIKIYSDKAKKAKFHISIADFYSRKSASILQKRITEELPSFGSKKLYIKTKKTNKISLLSGPYSSINSMKNDYIQLKNFGFEEMDISINE
jgi:hypothetical protein